MLNTRKWMENVPNVPNERHPTLRVNIWRYSGAQSSLVWAPVEYCTTQTSIFAGAFVEFCEIKLAILLDFEDSVFDLERIVRDDRFGVDIEDDVHLIGIFVGGT